MRNLYNIAIKYLALVVLFIVAFPASRWTLGLLCLTGLAYGIEYAMVRRRNERIRWASVNRPFAVVDWGLAGKMMRVPKNHEGFVLLCSAKNVEVNFNKAVELLRGGENQLFAQGNLPVLKVYFRYGRNVLHSQEQHEAYVKELLDAELLKFHIALETNSKPGQYLGQYFSRNQNGSKD